VRLSINTDGSTSSALYAFHQFPSGVEGNAVVLGDVE
jgi:hypothetical protein